MLSKDIDLRIVSNILSELPDFIDVTSISLVNGYHVNFTAGTEQIKNYEQYDALKSIQAYINNINSNDEKLINIKNEILIDENFSSLLDK